MSNKSVISKWEVYYREENRIVKGFDRHSDAIVSAYKTNDLVFIIPLNRYHHYWIYDGKHRNDNPSTITDDNMYAIIRPEGWSDEWLVDSEPVSESDESEEMIENDDSE